ncbi:MAG: hypothetical protein HON94_02715, partial [Methylococcales bacterium]|nr:hypothetical protein [Methylococcales bacterium]
MFTIFTIDKPDYLVGTLNSVAMLTSSTGPAGMGKMIGIGLIIGIFIAMFKSIITQKLEIQYAFIGFILYQVLFIPRVDVTVESVMTGGSVPVANVPIGVAAVGGITSAIGVKLAESYTTVFTTPGITESGGYMDALEVLISLRGKTPIKANQINGNGDLTKSLENYITECVIFEREMEG